jgi:tetratricopeptide (TPR) repeat protein
VLAAASFDDSFRAGLTALEHGDLTAAQTNLEEATRQAPADNPEAAARVWVALAQAYRELHQDAQAEDAALKAARFAAKYSARVPQNGDAFERGIELYFEAARPLLDRQNFGEAVVILEEGAKALPRSAQLELTLGVTYYGLRRFDDGADAFLNAIDAAPETEQPYNFLGKFLDRIPSRLPRVTQRFAEYESAHPANAAAWLLHAKALDAQAADPEVSLRLIEKSIALNPSDAAAHFEAGIVLDRLRRFADAAVEYKKAEAK